MGKFSELDLRWWEEGDLEDLEEEYHISELSLQELDKLATSLYWKAQYYIETANQLESKADTIRSYLRVIDR